MENLAGALDCDKQVGKELRTAGIIKFRRIPLKKRMRSEVPTSIMGLLIKDGKVAFKLTRAWYYWVVDGDVSLDIARILYRTEIGKKDVRVAGDCSCPPPEQWALPKKEVLYALGIYKKPNKEHPYGESPTYGELAEMCNSGKIQATRFVDCYHIDSQEGLNFFVRTLKEHNLIN